MLQNILNLSVLKLFKNSKTALFPNKVLFVFFCLHKNSTHTCLPRNQITASCKLNEFLMPKFYQKQTIKTSTNFIANFNV